MAARLPRSRRDATTLEINTRSIDKTLVMRPNICKCIRYIDLNDKTLLENTLGTLKKRNTPRRWCATRSEVALRVWRPAACLQAAQLAPKIYYNRPRSGPTEGQRQYGNGLFYSNATFETVFFFRLCCGLFVFWLVESSHLQRHKLKDPMVIGRRSFLSLCLACT